MINLTLLHTNDLHGRVGQVARIGTLVRRIRQEVAEKGDFLLYLDAGDSEDTTQLESYLTRGSSMLSLLKSTGCNQTVLGNATPIRYGPQAISNLASAFGQQILCANLFYNSGERPPGLTPYVIEEVNGHKVGIIGLTALVKVYKIFDLDIDYAHEKISTLVQTVRSEGARTVIVLSHLGQKDDIHLVERVAGIDVIIGGHSHDRISPPLQIKGALITQAGQFGEVLGCLKLEIDPGSGKVSHYSSELMLVGEDIPEDPVVLDALVVEKERVQTLMNVIVGEVNEPLDFSEDQECPAGNLLADALLERFPGFQVSFVLAQWQDGLKAGELTLGRLYSSNRSTANPARVWLTGAQLKQFFREALKKENFSRRLKELRDRKPGVPHVSGMRIVADHLNPSHIEIWMGDHQVSDDEVLSAVTTDFEISEILNYLPIPDEEVNWEVPTIMPEVLEDYIRRHSPTGKIPGGRIVFTGSIM